MTKEWKCPCCKQWVEIKLIQYAGAASTILGFPTPGLLAVCKNCGIVFDMDMVQKREKR